MSLSAPVTVQVRVYIDPTLGAVELNAILTVMDGSGDVETLNFIQPSHTSLTLHTDEPGRCVHSTALCCSTCIYPSMPVLLRHRLTVARVMRMQITSRNNHSPVDCPLITEMVLVINSRVIDESESCEPQYGRYSAI